MHYIIKLQEEFVQCCDHISMLVYNIMMIFLFGLMEKKKWNYSFLYIAERINCPPLKMVGINQFFLLCLLARESE